MKRRLIQVAMFILPVVILIGSFIASYLYFKDKETHINHSYLTVFLERPSEFYLQKADPHMVIYIDSELERNFNSAFTLQDDEGNDVSVKTKKVKAGQFRIVPPLGGYTKGQRYELALQREAIFSGEALHHARTLVFEVAKDDIERYAFNENVKVISAEVDPDVDMIELSHHDYAVGDIVINQIENEMNAAYKITEFLDDNTAIVEMPDLDEIFEELEIYGEYSWRADEIVANPDLEIEIINNIRGSSFYDALMRTAYASELPRDGQIKVSITPDDKDNSLEIEIKITLKPGQSGLFGISELRNHEVTLTLSAKVGLTVRANIKNVFNWDLSTALNYDLGWSVDIAMELKANEHADEINKLFTSDRELFGNKPNYLRHARKITEALDHITSDASSGELKLFDWKVVLPAVPFLTLSTEVKLFVSTEFVVELKVGQQYMASVVTGLSFQNFAFDPYSNLFESNTDTTLVLTGKAKVKAGVKAILRASIISEKLASIYIDPQVGLYIDLFITLPVIAPEDIKRDHFEYSYLEPGFYFGADFVASYRVFRKNHEFVFELIEKKLPIKALTLGDKKIARGIKPNVDTVRVIGHTVAIPDIVFDYYDVTKSMLGSEFIEAKDLRFDMDGHSLAVKDGKIDLPPTVESNQLFITSTYRHTNGRNYSTMFRVLLSGSTLEGRVSGFVDGLATENLENALVRIYTGTDTGIPLSTATTDETGKFSFNVTEGNYQLVISAEGYQTLTSQQSVAKDEIKYTEHIMLIDDEQTGSGSASGKVSNAFDGRGLDNVTIRLRNNWNSKTGPYVGQFETYTNSSGTYTISDVPTGYYTVEASREGFVNGYTNILVLKENAKSDWDFAITPIISPDEIRIILTWGQFPYDLDSHLIGPTPSGGSFNVYYANKRYIYEGVEMANLDVDDTTSYGPETITIFDKVHGKYIYAVHDYSNRSSNSSKSLSNSDAIVRVFRGSMQIGEFHVPTEQIGTYWSVFEIDRTGAIVPINIVSNHKPEL